MAGALDIQLAVDPRGVTPRAYTTALSELTRSLEELDRLSAPNPKDRVAWYVFDTRWADVGPRVRIRPDVTSGTRSTDELMRPSRALVSGVRQLRSSTEIPPDFTESVVSRVLKVGALTKAHAGGLRGVDISVDADSAPPTAIDAVVEENAERAIAPKSFAYGSIAGRLDLISARGRSTRIGLVPDWGSPITCVVTALDRDLYLRAFDRQVLVEGVVRRNGNGQVIRIDADSLTVLEPVKPATLADLRGALQPTDQTIAEFIEEQRGR